jgi:DNA-binding transcriptional LysR family regulator
LEIRHLRYFIAVAELRNFTRAAERCYVAQSALSQQISRLEQELGTPLFARTNRRVSMTPAGELLLPYAQRLVADEANVRAEMRSYLGLERGRLRLGLIQTSASALDVLRSITEFHETFAGIDVQITNLPSREMVNRVQLGLLDLAVVGLRPDEVPDDLESWQLASEPLVGVLGTHLAQGLTAPIDVADLLSRGQLINFAPGSGIRIHVEETLARAGFPTPTPSSFELTQATDLLRFTALGLGVTIVPRTLAEAPLAELPTFTHTYVVMALSDPMALHHVTAVFDPTRLSVAAREFLGVLRRTAETGATGGHGDRPR